VRPGQPAVRVPQSSLQQSPHQPVRQHPFKRGLLLLTLEDSLLDKVVLIWPVAQCALQLGLCGCGLRRLVDRVAWLFNNVGAWIATVSLSQLKVEECKDELMMWDVVRGRGDVGVTP